MADYDWRTISFRVRRADGGPLVPRRPLQPADVARICEILFEPFDGDALIDDVRTTAEYQQRRVT